MLRSTLILMTVLAVSCTDPDDGSDGADGTAGESAGDVPTDAMELSTWLEDGMYSAWDAESAPHAQTGTSPHVEVRTFINDTLAASLSAGGTPHPVGSAAVKELYDGMGTRTGWAVSVKVSEGDAAESWYWYLETGGMVGAEGNGVAGCDGCHSAGSDRFLTPFPLM